MPAHAGPKWSLLSPEERRPYEQMVKSDAADLEGTRPKGKMNNQVFDPNSERTALDIITDQLINSNFKRIIFILIWHID